MAAEPLASQDHRKIELQSAEDLTYLLANVRNAAAARLNEAFPHVDGDDGEDELRSQIEKLVNEYIDKTFTLAAPNLSINGMPLTPDTFLHRTTDQGTTTYEAFDAQKRQRVAELTTQEEKLLEDVAGLKRSVPARAAAQHAEMLKESLRRDDEMLKQRGAEIDVSGEGALEGLGPLERQDDIQREYKAAVEALGRLKSDMSAVVAKMERATVAGEYVVTQR